jgi:hypothetical protein
MKGIKDTVMEPLTATAEVALITPATFQVEIEIIHLPNGKKKAYVRLDPVTLSKIRKDQVVWHCSDPKTEVTVLFQKGPFDSDKFPVPRQPDHGVPSGPARKDALVCGECPPPGSGHKDHYKYKIVNSNNHSEVLADPEIIIKN